MKVPKWDGVVSQPTTTATVAAGPLATVALAAAAAGSPAGYSPRGTTTRWIPCPRRPLLPHPPSWRAPAAAAAAAAPNGPLSFTIRRRPSSSLPSHLHQPLLQQPAMPPPARHAHLMNAAAVAAAARQFRVP